MGASWEQALARIPYEWRVDCDETAGAYQAAKLAKASLWIANMLYT